MLRKNSFLGIGVFAVGVAVALAVPQNELQKPSAAALAANPTVGDFVLRYASTMGIAGKSNASPEQAAAALKKAGVIGSEPLNLSANLTEGDVVRIGGKHLRISSAAPERPFSNERFTEFFNVFAADIKHLASGGNGLSAIAGGRPPMPSLSEPDFDPHGKGKGKGKGTSPHEP